MKLNPEDLSVTSFDTGAEADYLSPVTIVTINDPTAATRCYYCPPASSDCY
jgi:DNA-binding LacI/PurR family transcriptional regulator